MPTFQDELVRALELLRASSRILLLAHRNPDADALGSALALSRGLRERGATTWVSFDQPAALPQNLRCLPGSAEVIPGDVWFAQDRATPDLIVTVDCGAAERVGRFQSLFDSAAVLVIDHHASNIGFGDVNLIDPTADANTVLIDRLLVDLGIELDLDLATLLYAGLATDTGSFRRAAPASHRLAAGYVETGVVGEDLLRRVSDSHPFGYLRALSRALHRVQLAPNAARGLGLVHTCVLLEDLAKARPEDAESVIDVIRTAEEAVVAAVFKEQRPGDWQISLRSGGAISVDRIAVCFGGGGHAFAAGYTWHGSYGEGILALVAALG